VSYELTYVRTDAWRDADPRMSGLQLPQSAADTEGRSALRSLAVSQTTTYRWTLAEDLAGFAEAGIAGIGLYRPKVEEVEEDAAIDLIRASGLTVSSLSWAGGFTGSDGTTQAEALFDAGEAVRLAAAVGAGTVALVSGGSGGHITKHARRLAVDAFRRLGDEAGEMDVRLAIHPLSPAACSGQSVLTTLGQALEAVSATGCENVGLVFDLFQFSREPDLLARIPSVAPHVHVVRLSDRRARADRWRLGDGAFAAGAVVQAFLDAGYDGPFEFDLWHDATAAGHGGYEDLLAACRLRFESFLAEAHA
jgi:sugar phosphate isomerase/epimerase